MASDSLKKFTRLFAAVFSGPAAFLIAIAARAQSQSCQNYVVARELPDEGGILPRRHEGHEGEKRFRARMTRVVADGKMKNGERESTRQEPRRQLRAQTGVWARGAKIRRAARDLAYNRPASSSHFWKRARCRFAIQRLIASSEATGVAVKGRVCK